VEFSLPSKPKDVVDKLKSSSADVLTDVVIGISGKPGKKSKQQFPQTKN